MPESPSPTGESSGVLPGSRRDRRRSDTKEKKMKVEILYFAGCPNHYQAVDRVWKILRQETASAERVEVQIKNAAMAQVMGFLGSPSIRIDGCDIGPAARSAQGFAIG